MAKILRPTLSQRNQDHIESEFDAVHSANGVIYCRVSSKEQIEGTSLESQEIACKEYARAHNINILKIFIERGESAKAADRTQLVELIDFCRTSKDKVRALLVWKLDRFARNVGDHFNIKATLLKYGVQVVSVTEPIDANPEGKLMETILAGFAQFDNDIRATRTVQGMRRKIQDGIFPWKPPLGYRSAARDGVKKTEPDEPDQPLFGLLQKAWREFATGRYSKADLKRLMDSWGIETRSGISMTHQSLDNLLRNPYYAGILVDPWSQEQHMGAHVAMVSPEDFARVQAVITCRNRSTLHSKERKDFPLRGIARCVECRNPLTGGFSKGRSKRYGYYSCGNRACPLRPNYPTQHVHSEFETLLDQIAPKHQLFTVLKNRIIKAAENRAREMKSVKERRSAELTRLDAQLQELIRMRSQQLVTDKEFLDLKAKILNRRSAIAESTFSHRYNMERVQADLIEIAKPLSRLRATWNSLPVGFLRRFNQLVLPLGFVVGSSRTAELGLLFRNSGPTEATDSLEVALDGDELNRTIKAIQAVAELFRECREGEMAA